MRITETIHLVPPVQIAIARPPIAAAQQGYALVLGVLGSALLLVWWLQLFQVGQRLNQAHQLRTALDTAAYSGAVVQSRSLNALALLNRAYIGHQLAAAQTLTLASWAQFARTQAQQAKLSNPPAWLIGSFFGAHYGGAYQHTRQIPALADLTQQLSHAFEQQQNFTAGLYNDFVKAFEEQTKSVRMRVIDEVFKSNIKQDMPQIAYELSFVQDDWAEVLARFKASQGIQWLRRLQQHYTFLQKRQRTVDSAMPVSKRCPHLRHQLRRIGQTELNDQGQWSAYDSLSFHALRSNRWVGCYYREYAMGWAWQPTQGVAFTGPYSEEARDHFADINFWQWVDKQSGWGFLSEGVNPLANTYALRDRGQWSAYPVQALDIAAQQQYRFELLLQADLQQHSFNARSAARSLFQIPPGSQWAQAPLGQEQGWYPFWVTQLSTYGSADF